MKQTLPQDTAAPPQPAATPDPRAHLHALVDTVPEAVLAPLLAWLEELLRYHTGQPVDASDEQRWHEGRAATARARPAGE